MFRTLVIGIAVAVGFVGLALSDTAPPAVVSPSASFDVGDRVSAGAERVAVSEVVALPADMVFAAEAGRGGNDGNDCTGNERLVTRCKGRPPVLRTITAIVRRAKEGTEFEFCLSERKGPVVECLNAVAESDGRAKVKFKDLRPGHYVVGVTPCDLRKEVHCP